MKSLLLYASSHGRTRKVIAEAKQRIKFPVEILDVKDLQAQDHLRSYDRWIVFCPTYGDEELQPDMEEFLCRLDLDLTGKTFTVCELGNYYGYDDYSFGALKIIRSELERRGARLWATPLSLDSLPKVPWEHLYDWIEVLNRQNEQP